MIVHRDAMNRWETDSCHGGAGRLTCVEMLADYRKEGAGIKFVHDDLLEPGATIGEHRHEDDEEIYVILEGRGTMTVDGREHPVAPGDIVVTHRGHSHGLANGSDGPMRLLVVGANV